MFPVNPRSITTSKQRTSASSSSLSGVPELASSSSSASSDSGSGSSSSALGGVELPTGLSVLPGPAMGEGCSLEGGCASCPFMRMNTLDALRRVCGLIGEGPAAEAMLEGYKPKAYEEGLAGVSSGGVGGNGQQPSIAKAGCNSILHMQDFQKGKRFSERLVKDIRGRHAGRQQAAVQLTS